MYFFFKTIWFLSPFGSTGVLVTLGVASTGLGDTGLADGAALEGGVEPAFLFPAVLSLVWVSRFRWILSNVSLG